MLTLICLAPRSAKIESTELAVSTTRVVFPGARRVVYRKNLLGVRRKMVGLGFPSRGRRICYGRHGELATNSREQQEIVTLSLQLLQNCLMLINTILVERTIEQEACGSALAPKIFGR